MAFRGSKHGLSRCGQVGIATRNMPNGDCTTQIFVDESEKTLVLYLKDETVLDLCDDGAFSSEQGDFEKAQRQTWP